LTRSRPIEFSGAEGNRLAGDLWDGHGRPVLFLHGAGQTRRAWDLTARRVADEGMRAVTLDMRGHGESDWVESGNYEFADFVADALVVLRDLARRFHERPVAVGASLGGLSSLGARLRDPALLEALVLVDITPRMDMGGVARIHGFMGDRVDDGFASLEEAAEAIARYLPDRKRPASPSGLAKNLRRAPDGRFRWHWDPLLIRSDRNIHSRAEGFAAELDAGLAELDLPVLLVRGVNSELVREDHARSFLEAVPTASFVDVAGAGHMIAGDRNDAFANAVISFLVERQAA
jgi:pimeloyl-ACP methyl ester carboxylesterase